MKQLKVLNAEGWLATGDIARVDDDGFFYIVDRKKDMILVSGFNVYPNEIEEVVAMNDKVLEVGRHWCAERVYWRSREDFCGEKRFKA